MHITPAVVGTSYTGLYGPDGTPFVEETEAEAKAAAAIMAIMLIWRRMMTF